MKKILKIIGMAAAGLIAVVLVLGATYEAIATRGDIDRLSTGAEFHRVNGKSLYIRCVGDSDTIMVFEPGAGSWSAQWTHIQDFLASNIRVCTYDRAGLGLSEASPHRMTGQDYVQDLHDLLRDAGEEPPYILVGHSLGGYLVRLFYDAHPLDVVGIVLADSAHEDQWDQFPPEIDELMTDALGRMQAAVWMTRFGVLRMLGMPDQGLPTEQQEAEAQAIMVTTQFWKALLTEFEAGLRTMPDEVRQTSGLGDVPLLVITAAKSADVYCATDGSSGVSCEEAQTVWDRLQSDLTTLSTDSDQVVLAGVTHAIYLDAPDALDHHIGEFVEAVRDKLAELAPDKN